MGTLDPVFLAQSKLRRRKYDECIEICTQLLEKNPLDQAVWYLKCKALTEKSYIDDTELEEEGIAEILLDENAIANLPRVGTSMKRPLSTRGSTGGGLNPGVRPLSSAGRPLTGFRRSGTATPASSAGRPGTGLSLEQALQNRPGTSRPVTSSGRFVRLGTASMVPDPGGPFVNVDKLKLSRYARRPALAKVLFEFLLYHENNAKKAYELASLATEEARFKDWWWKLQVGKCYYKLGLLREAEKQFHSSLRDQEMVITYLWLCKVFLRLDQPNKALEFYSQAAEKFPGEISLDLGIARVYDELNDIPRGVQFYKKVLHFDSSNVEAIACLASNYFYSDQPELALRYYRRLLQMGVSNTELWNNLGLCCYYAQQHDMTISCFERALAMADDTNMADVWYNIGHVAIGLGDLTLAHYAFKIAVSIDPKHAEAFNNLGVLEVRKGRKEAVEQARSHFQTASTLAPHLHEPLFNQALLLYNWLGDFQEAHRLVARCLDVYPEHEDGKELLRLLKNHFMSL